VEEDVDLGTLLKDSLRVVFDSARIGAVQVELILGDIPPRIRVDQRKVNQVLYNLLSNAVKFTPPGGKVVLDARIAKPFLLVSVSDTGIGLQSEDLERVFFPFESIHTNQSSKYPGTGLGLSLARKYVELHGGRIWAESPGKDRGSIFRFTLPLAAVLL
jgi:signal transduction histidine kinase